MPPGSPGNWTDFGPSLAERGVTADTGADTGATGRPGHRDPPGLDAPVVWPRLAIPIEFVSAKQNAPAMSDSDASNPDLEAAELAEVNRRPLLQRLGYYSKKSGPGWLQAAITLGGGSLASSLFLGVILQYHLMWLQPMAMVLGVIMLSAIG